MVITTWWNMTITTFGHFHWCYDDDHSISLCAVYIGWHGSKQVFLTCHPMVLVLLSGVDTSMSKHLPFLVVAFWLNRVGQQKKKNISF